jgi:hypothetical protein
MKNFILSNGVSVFINQHDGLVSIMIMNYNTDNLIVRYSEDDFLDIVGKHFADVHHGNIIIEEYRDTEDGGLKNLQKAITLNEYITNHFTKYEANLLKDIATNYFITSTIIK